MNLTAKQTAVLNKIDTKIAEAKELLEALKEEIEHSQYLKQERYDNMSDKAQGG